jgi:prepilin-type N-terminal cleavage/methylation domain-containing protein
MKDLIAPARIKAFSLIELLMVIVIIGILVGLLFPAIRAALLRAKMAETLNNGRNLYLSIFSDALDEPDILPRSSGANSFANSTEYWKSLVSNGTVDVTFDFFSADGLPEYAGQDPNLFSADQNAWCISADVSEATRNMTPVLFTRNIEIENLDDALDNEPSENPPFGQRGVAVVYRDGSCRMLKRRHLAVSFNPSGADNAVLRP